MRFIRSSIALSVVACALAVSRVAHADDSDLERARALFDEAGELERQGQWAAAQERLRAAIRIHETPHLRYALGWALENDDKLIEARAEYATALRLARATPGAEEVSRLAQNQLAELERKTPMVQVRIPGAADGARVFVDGRPAALRDDVALAPANPGMRVVRVERPSSAPVQQTVLVSRGSLRTVEVRGGGLHDAGATPQGERSSVLPWVLIGGGAALGVGGAVLFLSSASDASTRDENMRRWCDATACVGGTTATQPETPEAASYRREALDASSRGNTKQVVGGIVGGVGIVGIAVGAYLVLHERGAERAEGPKPRRALTNVRVGGAPMPGGGSASASFSF